VNTTERLEWLVAFAQAELTMATAEDWEHHLANANALIKHYYVERGKPAPSIGIHFLSKDWTDELSRDDLRDLHRVVKNIIDGVVRARQGILGGRLWMGENPSIEIKSRWTVWPVIREKGEGDAVMAIATHSRKDAFILVLMHLIASDAHGLRVCPIDERVFVRKGRMLYCSRRCTNAAMQRRSRRK
jgi:hypothetical protein